MLSSANDSDIKHDPADLNTVVNAANTQALKLRAELIKSKQNKNIDAYKDIMKENTALSESTNSKLIGLQLKSQEVQAVRIKIVEGNMKSIKLVELASKEDKSDQDSKQLVVLAKQSAMLQSLVAQELGQLNSRYGD